jgi:nucleoside-diphosphate-sugar epimerase
MDGGGPDSLNQYRLVNVQGTLRMLKAARDAGARRFIFVSTIKVLGEETEPGIPFNQQSPPSPVEAYATSKLEAEATVAEFCARHDMEWTIVRPVLVFGPGVGANFAQLIRVVDWQLPLPLASVRNARSFLFVDNLSDFLITAVNHSFLANRAVNLADPLALSTPQLIRRLAQSMGRRARLLPFPPAWLELAAGAIGKGAGIRRLTRSLQVDMDGLFRDVRWQPPISLDEALRETVADELRRL